MKLPVCTEISEYHSFIPSIFPFELISYLFVFLSSIVSSIPLTLSLSPIVHSSYIVIVIFTQAIQSFTANRILIEIKLL